MTQIITQEQLDLFNRNFEIKMLRKNTDYTEHERLNPERFDTNRLENARLSNSFPNCSKENHKIYFISNKNKEFNNQVKTISTDNTMQDIRNFIINEMENILNQKLEQTQVKSFKEKLEVFNQNFTIHFIKNIERYHGSDELTFENLNNPLPVQDAISFKEQKDAYGKILESYHAIYKGNELIQKVENMIEVKYFIENDMENYL
mgnify:CR=1 FL=1